MTNYRRNLKKWLYGRCPGFKGSFPYYGIRVFFPPRSLIFELACDQGIYESVNQKALAASLRNGSTVLDIGANIGLMSVPLLAKNESIRVISIEPSPATFASLQRTIAASPWRDRWSGLDVAVGDTVGTVDFYCASPALGAFDGIRDTHRAGATTQTTVAMTTVDQIWRDAGKPDVSTIKIDVEGAEAPTLRGAAACVAACRPAILAEWNEVNLVSFKCPPETLLHIAMDFGYDVFALPSLVPTLTKPQFLTQMAFDESFLLLPKP